MIMSFNNPSTPPLLSPRAERLPFHSHALARFATLFDTPFFRLAIDDPDSLPNSLLFSSFGYSTILIAILASSSKSSVFFHRTPVDSPLILAAPNMSIFDPHFLQILDLPSQISNRLPSLLDASLLF